MATTYPLTWDETGKHFYKTGVDHGVIYDYDETNRKYTNGEAWNGLTGFTKSPSGAEETKLYADNIKYLSLRSAEDFGATITCYTYPALFEKKNGAVAFSSAPGVRVYQQARKSFGLCVRTLIGDDVHGNDGGYELHLMYGLTASPSEESFNTVNDSPEAIEFSYELSSVPVTVSTKVNNEAIKPTAIITINSTEVLAASRLTLLEEKLYGKAASGADPAVPAELPMPDDVIAIMAGTYTGG